MNIQEISWLHDTVIQDCAFANIGHFLGSQQHRLVPIADECDLQQALTKPEIAGIILHKTIPIPDRTRKGIIISDSPVITALKINHEINSLEKVPEKLTSIHPSACIHPSAKIDPNNVIISKGTEIGENVVIHQGCKIGEKCAIGPNTIVGKSPLIDIESYVKESIQGNVEIMDEVSIHANCLIEQPVFNDTTTIGFRCHIDNRVTIHQGVTINKLSLVTANSAIGEYATIGKDCWVGLRTSINRGIKIGDHCYITLGSTTTEDIPSGMIVKNNWKISRERFKGMII